ncbi:unnamed protein product [Nesidiocoris tenuis]|uniref:Uncharacterized protein n=1 Tax=Nesidiocoris tenuis TaxID=355587 RepID=A0A6H5HDM4_9HEMI|nr:unnamed protein product [Nesidiocoris tenuis]
MKPTMIRRGSYMAGEPLIVVEESGGIIEEEEEEQHSEGYNDSPSAPDSPSLNPYLLSPYRDMRKRSLPTPHCTTGIMASQVRRLSEQGGETGKGPSPIEQAFLATLSQAPAPTPGGRRHSVVTISRVPQTSGLFGRNRRESISAFPSSGLPLGRLQRKDSSSSIARSPSISGSNFNLQLDIMDDIADIKARKAKLKMWQTDSQEKVCEVEEAGATSLYHQKENRRFSDRRASELPKPLPGSGAGTPPAKPEGIVCSNTDLSIMSSLTSSAQEIGSQPVKGQSLQTDGQEQLPQEMADTRPTAIDSKRLQLKNNRSNSFDISLFPEEKRNENKEKPTVPGNWFTRRHLPMANKKYLTKPDNNSNALEDGKLIEEKLVWDKPTGAVVDPQMIGSAIEVFLNKRASDTPAPSSADSLTKKSQQSSSSFWGGFGEPKETDEEVSCDNSICSTLKDLFIK